MVSISSKMPTTRRATATGRIYLPSAAFDLLADSPSGGNFKKGDVLGTARIAGIMAGKKTSELIPLCHPIGLTDLKVRFRLESEQQRKFEGSTATGGWVGVEAMAECEGKTGVEVRILYLMQPLKTKQTLTLDFV
jgi:molybdenum cofactor biosynthesis protein MoaC